MRKGGKSGKAGPSRPKKDHNAPKYPLNPYTIFFKHFQAEFQRKNPDRKLDGRSFTLLAAQGWKTLDDEERKPFQELAQKEKERYAKEMAAYKKTKEYRDFISANNQAAASSSTSAKINDIEVFSAEFLKFNKNRETELRNLRRNLTTTEEEIGKLNADIDQLKHQLDVAYASLPVKAKISFEKERQYMIWCREIVCQLDKAGLLEETALTYESTPEEVVECLEAALQKEETAGKVEKALAGLLLEIF
ncbi:High mobility group protein 20A-like protein [Aphelenchoides fujianensis]|nr:High mobility group protein 20A-like protein [Aphelenchoides fujianensis]